MIPLPDSPDDIVTSLYFSPQNQLLTTSWDNKIRLYDCESSKLFTKISTNSTPLSSLFVSGTFYSGYINGSLKSLDLENQSLSDIAGVNAGSESLERDHSIGIAHLAHAPESSPSSNATFVSASWNGGLNVIDTRSNKSSFTSKLPNKVFAMDSSQDYLVVGMSSRLIHIFDYRNYNEPIQIRESGLKFQIKDLKCWDEGYAISSIDGRVAIEYYDHAEDVQAKKYAFKCHRVVGESEDQVFPVNSIQFNKAKSGVLYTGGNDTVCTWNFIKRKRVKQNKLEREVSKIAISNDGEYLAVCTSVSDNTESLQDSADKSVESDTKSNIYIKNLAMS